MNITESCAMGISPELYAAGGSFAPMLEKNPSNRLEKQIKGVRLIQGEDEGSTKFYLSRYSRKKEMEGSLRMAGFFLHSSTKCRSSFTFTASMAESYREKARAIEREREVSKTKKGFWGRAFAFSSPVVLFTAFLYYI